VPDPHLVKSSTPAELLETYLRLLEGIAESSQDNGAQSVHLSRLAVARDFGRQSQPQMDWTDLQRFINAEQLAYSAAYLPKDESESVSLVFFSISTLITLRMS
jgi:hypothetical protein